MFLIIFEKKEWRMCIVALKYFNTTGWVGVKNRDRNYKPLIYIRQSVRRGIERIFLWDDITKYTEGLNEFGVSILSASVDTKYDEKEGKISQHEEEDGQFYSPDGKKIRTALFEKTPEDAIKSLKESNLPGHIIVFNKTKAYLIEAAFKKPGRNEKDFVFKCNEVNKNNTIVRTNHGIWIPWSGYQEESKPYSRKSSEKRLEKVLNGIKHISDPHNLLDALSHTDEDDPQMNPLRLDTKRKSLRTTGQIMLIPSELTLYYKPIWCEIQFNFGRLDSTKTKTFFQILSSRGIISPTINGERIIDKAIRQ